MKSKLLLLNLILALAFQAQGSLYQTGTIPDGNLVGVAFTGTYDEAAAGATVSSLAVNLQLSGGFNGDLYSYLVAPNGTLVVLLNRPGVTTGNPFGYSGSGLNVSLSDAASSSIQTTAETGGSVFTGSYQAAGTLANFNGSSADGTWTLYFADESAGGGQATLSGWSLDITAVPEPVNAAMGIFACCVVGMAAIRQFKRFNTR